MLMDILKSCRLNTKKPHTALEPQVANPWSSYIYLKDNSNPLRVGISLPAMLWIGTEY